MNKTLFQSFLAVTLALLLAPLLHGTSYDYVPYKIDLQEGVSQTGAQTYSIPLRMPSGTAPAVQLSLQYSSQSGEGVAGYGWNVGGLSRISLTNRSRHYHGENHAAVYNLKNQVYSLDGVALVENRSVPELAEDYPLETATGHILVRQHTDDSGRTLYFDALLPDGSKAVYGEADAKSPEIQYPLTRLEDVNGNVCSISYGGSGVKYPTELVFKNVGGYRTGRVDLDYSGRSSYAGYYAGKSLKINSLLSSVSMENGAGEQLWKYKLVHRQQYGTYQLYSVECGSAESHLRPILFDYGLGGGGKTPGFSDRNGPSYLLTTLTGTSLRYVRGKFHHGDYTDGLIILPDLSNYDICETRTVGTQKYYRFGSRYSPGQKILITPTIELMSQCVEITAEDGFQAIEAIDVDEDGTDEVVKVNFAGIDGDNVNLRVKVYKFNWNSTALDSTVFNVRTAGVVTDGRLVSPLQRAYWFGKFDVRGGAQLVTAGMSTDFRGNHHSSRTVVLDLRTGESRESGFLYPSQTSKNYLVADIDGDGVTEICCPETGTSGMFAVYRCTGLQFRKDRMVGGVDWTEYFSGETTCADINGDGLLDILIPPELSSDGIWKAYIYDGRTFIRKTLGSVPLMRNDKFFLMDVNRDGMTDLLVVRNNGNKVETYLNGGDSFSEEPVGSALYLPSYSDVVPANIIDYGSMSHFIVVKGHAVYGYSYSENLGENRLLTRVEDSFGVTRMHDYSNLSTYGSGCYSNAAGSPSCKEGYARKVFPLYLLTGTTVYSEREETNVIGRANYIYNDAVVSTQGLGFCGFGKVTCVDEYTGVSTVNEYDPERFGIITRSTKRLLEGSEKNFETVENTYSDFGGHPVFCSPVLTESVHTDALTGRTTVTSLSYDSYDCVERQRTDVTIGEGNNAVISETKNYYKYSLSADRYVLGSVEEQRTWTYREENGQKERWMEKSLMEYDDKFRLTSKRHYKGLYVSTGLHITVRPSFRDCTELVGETRYGYDRYGNLISEKTSKFGASEFVGRTMLYTGDGLHLTMVTDALGCRTEYYNFNKFGLPKFVLDDHGNETVLHYDPWGNVVRKETPGGGVSLVKREWGGSGVYTVTDSSNFSPATVTHYDALGRKVRRETIRFDGQWQKTDYEYDRQGRLAKVSLPYRGTEPSRSDLWKTYSYDAYGRLTKEFSPGHSFYRDYDGVRVREIRDGVGRIMTADAAANIVEVIDDGGTIRYTLRNDGQPSAVTCGEYVTSFTYDKYGRRISISDPSAGTQTDTTSWSSDGTSVRVQTNPNGKITTWYDKYGRTVKVDREGEYSTFYVYDSYGRLQSETSTNGTAKSYTYDELDRPVTEKEIVPDGKWLLKTYGYAPGSRLEGTRFDSQNGYITTEHYQYANDNLLAVSLSRRRLVLGIAEENDLGQPVHVETGNVSRIYEYTPESFPVSRTIYDVDGRPVQNFEYEFREHDSRLTYRTDMSNGTGETFDYDELNRLTSFGGREAVFDEKGNVVTVGGVGDMGYKDEAHPYQLIAFRPEDDSLVPTRSQSIDYTCYGRPSLLREGSRSASFTYNGAGDRVKMFYSEGVSTLLRRYYIGGRYELDEKSDGSTVERLYVGGDAYSAPAALEKRGDNGWELLNIGRDYLGSITHVLDENGTVLGEYSYDAWGRMRDPETLEPYAPGTEPELRLGRGFTAHEHLPWFGLINMNARLYDPLLCRFLSPDPYVQAPDFTQSFNRYAYALNNPLAYSDPNGEFVITTTAVALIVGATVGVAAGIYGGWRIAEDKGATGWEMAGYMAGGGVIGGLAGFFAGAAGIYAGAGIGVGGFLGGAVSGGTAGLVGGFIDGFGMSMLAGNGFNDALYAGGVQALISGLGGGIIGGVSGGIYSSLNRQNFWTGRSINNSTKTGYVLSDDSVPRLREPSLEDPADLMELPSRSKVSTTSKGLKVPSGDQLHGTNFISNDLIEEGISKTLNNTNDMRHIFAEKHKLGPLVELLGKRNLIRVTMYSLNGRYPISGTYQLQTNIYGYDIWVRGNVVNGVPRIGTMFIP